MKQYFKYSSGYVNIDAENLFLTNSGNWQETRELGEKSKATIAQNEGRINKMQGFVYAVFGGIGLFLWQMIEDKKVSIGIIIALCALAYKVFEYFKSDFGKRYKIPLAKIHSIDNYDKDGLKIYFLNAANEDDFEIIEKVEDKGFKILGNLNLLKSVYNEI